MALVGTMAGAIAALFLGGLQPSVAPLVFLPLLVSALFVGRGSRLGHSLAYGGAAWAAMIALGASVGALSQSWHRIPAALDVLAFLLAATLLGHAATGARHHIDHSTHGE